MAKGQMSLKEVEKWKKDNKESISELERNLIISEGFVPQFYYDSRNILTVGVGHNCKDNYVSMTLFNIIREGNIDERIEFCFSLLNEDIYDASCQLIRFIDYKKTCSTAQYNSLIEMVFHMGIGSFSGFEKMIKAINLGDWKEAYKQGKDSTWFRKFPDRAIKVLEGFKK